MPKKTAQPGSISHGTCREEDLLPAFLFLLEDLWPERAMQIGQELIELGFGYSQCGVCFGPQTDWPDKPEEISYILNEDLWDALNQCAPEGHYFGAHEGDGSDYGFWPITDDD